MNPPPPPPVARLLESIRGPADVKALAPNQLPQLAQEIRAELVAVTSRNGGHIGPNLGVVELTIALHRIFDSPDDQFVFDVAHQGYVHKLLTGRGGEFFRKLRQSGGASGFLYRSESTTMPSAPATLAPPSPPPSAWPPRATCAAAAST